MDFVFPPGPVVALPVRASNAWFPVHRVYCVGRNYAEHAKEMGENTRAAPFFFMKPADAVLPVLDGRIREMPYPSMTTDLQHEVELVIALSRGGRDISKEEASKHIYGYAVGVDMTRRDLQAEAKRLGRPWCTSKGFDYSAPISAINPATTLLEQGSIYLKVNGLLRQEGDIQQMIWSIAETIQHLSLYFELQAGDLIFTGTPAGVATVNKGDLLEAGIAGVGELKIKLSEV